MQDLLAIPRICSTLAGIQSVVIFTPENVETPPTSALTWVLDFVDPNKVYAIAFGKHTARFRETPSQSRHGDFYTQSLTGFIPKRRVEMETLKKRARNRRIHAIYIDRDGGQYFVWNARMYINYDSGEQPGSRNGYSVEITSKNILQVPTISGNPDLPTPGPGEGESDSCCITILPTSVPTPPTPTGNVENLNKIVHTADNTQYFIDKNGRAVLLGRPAPKYIRLVSSPDGKLYYMDLPSGTLPDPADFPFPTYDEKMEISRRVFVKSSSRWISYKPPRNDGYTIEIITGAEPKDRIHFQDPPRGTFIEVYIWDFPDKQIFPPLTPDPGEDPPD